MKVNLSKITEDFNVLSQTICGVDCFLITPKIDAKWSAENLFLRSLIVNEQGEILSSGFPKFFNFNEKPECYPNPDKFKDWRVDEKIDGSLVICDWINGEINLRTRGTVNSKRQENWEDFELLTTKYPQIISFLKQNDHLSLLFEIVTPNNVIVIPPKENKISFYFLGAMNKNGCCSVSSSNLVEIWRKIGCVPMPQSYQFDSIPQLVSIAKMIKDWKGKEGVVISYNNGQNRIKLKSDWYCWIHRIKSQLNSENSLIDYYIDNNLPSYEDFFKKIESEFDFELATQLIPQLLKVTSIGEVVKKDINNIKSFVHSIRNFESRKAQAEYILTSYKKTPNKTSLAFSFLDGKDLSKAQILKLFVEYLGTWDNLKT